MKKKTDIGLVVAMKEEADILATSLDLASRPLQPGNFLKYSNSDDSIVMYTPGIDLGFRSFGKPVSRVGKVSAGVATTILVNKHAPTVIVNCGTAGGIQSAGAQIGDIVFAQSVTSHDIRIPLPGYEEYGVRLITPVGLEKLTFIRHPYKTGVVSSGESFASSSEEWRAIKKNAALAKEMEAAGVLQALQILQYRGLCYVIKAITDISDEFTLTQTPTEQFLRNFDLAMNELSIVIGEFVANRTNLLAAKKK